MELFHRPTDPGVGYWGERTAALDWCESNYTWSYYIAEFFNTISSLPAAFFALYAMHLTYKYGYDKRFVVVNLMLGLVGLGSAAFHGTLLYTGQIFDELPMVYASMSFLYVILEMESKGKPIHKYLAPILLAYCGVFTLVYLYLPSFFIFFLLSYIAAILTLSYRCYLIYKQPQTLSRQKLFIVGSIGFYIGGWLVFWVPEIIFCDRIQSLNFHAWWHVTSTLGAFSLLLFSVFQRELHKGRHPSLNYNTIGGIPLLPYVHVEEAPQQLAPIVRVLSKEEQERQQEQQAADVLLSKNKAFKGADLYSNKSPLLKRSNISSRR